MRGNPGTPYAFIDSGEVVELPDKNLEGALDDVAKIGEDDFDGGKSEESDNNGLTCTEYKKEADN